MCSLMKLLTASNGKVRSYHIDFGKYTNNGKLLKYKAASQQHLFDCKNVFFAKILVIILIQRSSVCSSLTCAICTDVENYKR